jgi:hypothetical protein
MKTIQINWLRRGLLIPPGDGQLGFTHASHPCIMNMADDHFLLIFSMRDHLKRSHIFVKHCMVDGDKITAFGSAIQVLSPGRIGTFDSEGLLVCCPVELENGKTYLYYSGWNNLSHGLWLCDTGLALVDKRNLGFSRFSEGPVMGRDRHNPFFAAATSVLQEKGLFRAWYNSGVDWIAQEDGAFKPKYGIHYAESSDGIDWDYFPNLVIPFKDAYEHSFGRPTVAYWDSCYHMWFSCRGANHNPEYKIGYAASLDGLNWERNDSLSGLGNSSDTSHFDSIAQAYPYVFEHKGVRFLLYCGNSYGSTGFGYAIQA